MATPIGASTHRGWCGWRARSQVGLRRGFRAGGRETNAWACTTMARELALVFRTQAESGFG